jgi:alanyl-tRNA synthetase
MQSEIAELRKQVAMNGTDVGLHDESINGVAFFGQILADVPGKDLRGLIDEHKKRLGSGVIVLISGAGGKATIAVGVTNDLTDSLSAVDLARTAAEMLGGKGGGGRPDMAQAGGQSVKNSEVALDAVRKNLEG